MKKFIVVLISLIVCTAQTTHTEHPSGSYTHSCDDCDIRRKAWYEPSELICKKCKKHDDNWRHNPSMSVAEVYLCKASNRDIANVDGHLKCKKR